MKQIQLALSAAIVGMSIGLVGCSTAPDGYVHVTDHEYVNKVERNTRAVSTNQIYWINPPKEKKLVMQFKAVTPENI